MSLCRNSDMLENACVALTFLPALQLIRVSQDDLMIGKSDHGLQRQQRTAARSLFLYHKSKQVELAL